MFRWLPHRLLRTGSSGRSLSPGLLLLSRKYITSLPLKDCVQKLNAHSNGWRTMRDE
jgi:hypothetical protein